MEKRKFRFNVMLGSRSEQKSRAVSLFFHELVDLRPHTFDFQLYRTDTPSGVAKQPFGVEEIAFGAQNRARGAYDHLVKHYHSEGSEHVSFGIESGLIGSHDTGLYFDVAIVVLKTQSFGEFMAMTPGVVIPRQYVSEACIQGFHDTTYADVMLKLHPEATSHNIPLDPHGFLYPGSGGRSQYLKAGVFEVMTELLSKMLM